MSLAWEITRPQGTVAVSGLFPEPVSLDLMRPLIRELWVTFPICYGYIDGSARLRGGDRPDRPWQGARRAVDDSRASHSKKRQQHFPEWPAEQINRIGEGPPDAVVATG